MKILTSHLRHGGVRVVIVLAGLLDLRLEIGLVLLCGLKTGGCRLRLALRGGGIGVGLFHSGLRRRNLGIRQLVKLHNLVRQIGFHTGQLGTKLSLALGACGLFVLGVQQFAIGIRSFDPLDHGRERSYRHRGAHCACGKHGCDRPAGFRVIHTVMSFHCISHLTITCMESSVSSQPRITYAGIYAGKPSMR